MKKDNQILKVSKCFISIMKEKLWLEQMAQSGWILSDISMGIRFTFIKSEPLKLVYEIDRFNLPKKPTLIQIRHKQEFLSMAREMGWKIISHDEDLNYYLCKEYREGEINELYNDFESKQYRAQKYQKRYKEAEIELMKLAFLIAIVGLVTLVCDLFSSTWKYGFTLFVIIYELICLSTFFLSEYLGSKYYMEFLLSAEEYKEQYKRQKNIKTIYKLNINYKGLKKFLSSQSRKGYHLIDASFLKYKFIIGEPKDYLYSIDTQSLTNHRMKAKGSEVFHEKKDWNGLNNDWQVKSLQDAENKSWNFVCAMLNRTVIYRSQENILPEPLNNEKQERGIYCMAFLGKVGVIVLIASIIGFICGILAGYFGI